MPMTPLNLADGVDTGAPVPRSPYPYEYCKAAWRAALYADILSYLECNRTRLHNRPQGYDDLLATDLPAQIAEVPQGEVFALMKELRQLQDEAANIMASYQLVRTGPSREDGLPYDADLADAGDRQASASSTATPATDDGAPTRATTRARSRRTRRTQGAPSK